VQIKKEIAWQSSQVTLFERQALLGHQSMTLWFTGLSGSGKSTLAYSLERRLISMGMMCCVLDGDNVRHCLNRDLGFSPLDRSENIRLVAEVARLMMDAGVIVITSFISPYREDRAMARSIIGAEKFVEIYLCAALDICEKRDTKGRYRKARSGELPCFTGLSSPYEVPEDAELIIDTSSETVDACVEYLLRTVVHYCSLE